MSGGPAAYIWSSEMNRTERPRLVLRATVIAAVLVAISAGAIRADATWTAQPVTVSDLGDWASFEAISCPAAGNCTAVGSYYTTNPAGESVAFTQSSSDGVWAEGTAATFAPGVEISPRYAEFLAVSCPAPGECLAVGKFQDVNGWRRAFAQRRSNRIWLTAEPLPLPVGDGDADLVSVACSAPGTCTAVGHTGERGLVASWSDGVLVEATAATFGTASRTRYTSVSCPTVGACGAAGWYQDADYAHAFTQLMSTGAWQEATAATFGDEAIAGSTFFGISCPAPGSCTAAGFHGTRPMVRASQGGTWSAPLDVPIPAWYQSGELRSISCSAPGTCLAAGALNLATWGYEAVTLASSDGTWGQILPARIPAGRAWLDGPMSRLLDVSCSPSGMCRAVGFFKTSDRGLQPFSQGWSNGVRGTATEVSFPEEPGAAYSDLRTVSCPVAGDCAAAGQFLVASTSHVLAFTASGPNGTTNLPMVEAMPFGTGAGSVSSGDGRVACTWSAGARQGACTDTTSGTVTLTASASDGSVFAGWSGACTGTGGCVLQGRDAVVGAEFTPVPVNRLATKIEYTGSPRAGTKASLTLSALLRTVPGAALPGQTLSFALCDSRTLTAVTNRKGVASTTTTAPATKGACKVRVTYAGSGTYLPADGTGSVKVF